MPSSIKLFTAALLATALYLPTAHAAPANGVYVGGQIGYNHPVGENGGNLDDSASFTGVVGYRINPNVRVDGEISYRQNDYSESVGGISGSGHIKGTGFLANAWYDFTNSSAFTPYIGGGIGFMHGSAKVGFPGFITTIDDGDNAFTYQLGAGVAYNLTNNIAITGDYRWIDTGDFKFAVTNGAVSSLNAGDYRAHEVRVGVRYAF